MTTEPTKRKRRTSPTQRSLKLMRDRGYRVWVVEKRIPGMHIMQDMYGFIDIHAMKPGVGFVGVQTTTGANMAARIAKIKELPAARVWLDSLGLIYVHGWRKVGARGKRKLWECREVRLVWDGKITEVNI
jgi:hypothetical protein